MSTEQKNLEVKQVTLDDLFKHTDKVDDQELAQALYGKIYLTDKSEKVFIDDKFAKMASINVRLVLAGLARHALLQKGKIKDEDLAKDSEWYATQIQEKPKTVSEHLSRLKRDGIFDKSDKGYQVPTWSVRKAIEFLNECERKCKSSN